MKNIISSIIYQYHCIFICHLVIFATVTPTVNASSDALHLQVFAPKGEHFVSNFIRMSQPFQQQQQQQHVRKLDHMTELPTITPTTLSPSLSITPTTFPTTVPTTFSPTLPPTLEPTKKNQKQKNQPTKVPTFRPTKRMKPTNYPTSVPTTVSPTIFPTAKPTTHIPIASPTDAPAKPTTKPTTNPIAFPITSIPTNVPSEVPTSFPQTAVPTVRLFKVPDVIPTTSPTTNPVTKLNTVPLPPFELTLDFTQELDQVSILDRASNDEFLTRETELYLQEWLGEGSIVLLTLLDTTEALEADSNDFRARNLQTSNADAEAVTVTKQFEGNAKVSNKNTLVSGSDSSLDATLIPNYLNGNVDFVNRLQTQGALLGYDVFQNLAGISSRATPEDDHNGDGDKQNRESESRIPDDDGLSFNKTMMHSVIFGVLFGVFVMSGFLYLLLRRGRRRDRIAKEFQKMPDEEERVNDDHDLFEEQSDATDDVSERRLEVYCRQHQNIIGSNNNSNNASPMQKRSSPCPYDELQDTTSLGGTSSTNSSTLSSKSHNKAILVPNNTTAAATSGYHCHYFGADCSILPEPGCSTPRESARAVTITPPTASPSSPQQTKSFKANCNALDCIFGMEEVEQVVPLNATTSPPLTPCNIRGLQPAVNRSGLAVTHIIDTDKNDDDSHEPQSDDENDVSLHMTDVDMPVTNVLEQAELMNHIMDELNKDQSNIMYCNDSVDGTGYARSISNSEAAVNLDRIHQAQQNNNYERYPSDEHVDLTHDFETNSYEHGQLPHDLQQQTPLSSSVRSSVMRQGNDETVVTFSSPKPFFVSDEILGIHANENGGGFISDASYSTTTSDVINDRGAAVTPNDIYDDSDYNNSESGDTVGSLHNDNYSYIQSEQSV